MAEFYGYTRFEKNEVILGAPAISNVPPKLRTSRPSSNMLRYELKDADSRKHPRGSVRFAENGTTIDRSGRVDANQNRKEI
jgi:hypothetical protein